MDMAQFSQAALILLREGAEALLVIAALSAYLVRIGAADKQRVLYGGAGLAVVASLAAAWVFYAFFGGGHSDVVEAFVLLIAAGVLLYVSGWLFARRNTVAWQAYLRDRVDAALGRGGMLTLGFAAFLAVFREGAETILFLHALALGGEGWTGSLLAGIGAGAAAIVLLYLAFRKLAVRLPLKPFFLATAILLYGLAVLFVGSAIAEFQELLWLPYTEAEGFGWLASIGLSETWEGLGVQSLMIVLAFLLAWWPARRRAPVPAG